MAIKVQAVRFQQKQEEVTLYLSVLPAHVILSHCKVDYFGESNSRGYQRPLAAARLKQVSSYIRSEEGMLPTSILLCLRQPDRADFEVMSPANGSGEWGVLTIHGRVRLWVVDGQHRLFGIRRAYMRDGVTWARNYPLPVTIVDGIDDYREMRYFHVINTRQKGVPTDVVDRHLLYMREGGGLGALSLEGERSYYRARATRIVDILRSSPESPWLDRVHVTGRRLWRAQHLARLHSLVRSLEPALHDPFLERLSDDEVGKLLVNFWAACRARWRRAFDDPQAYFIQRSAGLTSLHLIFPDVVALCREGRDFSAEHMGQFLAELGLSSGFWHREHGHPLTKESSSKYLRMLARYLRDRLPRPVLPRL
jgi:DGQHR domain-containing protein